MVKDYYLGRTNMLAYLADLGKRGDAVTIYFPPGLSPEQAETRLSAALGNDIPDDLARAVTDSWTGACLIWGAAKVLVRPPFPITDNAIFAGCVTDPLVEILQRERLIGIVLVRLGSYAVGVYRRETRVVSKVGTGLVHARHKKGGSSSARFRRHREKQIEQFLIRVCGKVGEYLGPHLGDLEHVVFGGAWTTIEMLMKQCPHLRQLDDRALPPLLDIPDPRQDVLESSARRVWSSRVMEWGEGEVARASGHVGVSRDGLEGSA